MPRDPGRDGPVSVALKGFCMGAADVVPGVSGGTVALVLGIYQRLLEAIKAFDLGLLGLLGRGRLREACRHVDLVFLVPLAAGIFAALMFFTRVVPLPSLILSHPEQVFALFFGLIAGSIVVLLRGIGRLRGADLLALAAGIVAGLWLVNLVPTETPETSWFLFATGAIAISALILPGISGSFMLLVLKKYAYVFDAIGRFDFTVLVPFALGAVVGLMTFSRVLTWLLHRYYRPTLTTIIGVLVGSLWLIWPFQHRVYEVIRAKPRLVSSTPYVPAELDANVVLAALLLATGLALVLALGRVAAGRGDRRV